MSNAIIQFLTNDLMVGWDKYGQFNVMRRAPDGGYETRFLMDPRGLVCPVCNHGWEMSGPGISDQAQRGIMGKLTHLSCLERHLSILEYGRFEELLDGADIRYAPIEPIPNEYGGAYNSSWHRASVLRPNAKKDWDTGRFTIRMGRRKRVWSMHMTIGSPLDDKQLAQVKSGTLGLWPHTKDLDHAELLVHTYTVDECKIVMEAFAAIIKAIDVPMIPDAT